MVIFKAIKKVLSVVSKVFLVIAVFVVIINLFSAFTAKDRVIIDPQQALERQREKIYTRLNDSQFKEAAGGEIGLRIYRGALCGLVGEACTNNPADGDKNFEKSLIGMATNLMTLPLANPPASGIFYTLDSLNKAGFFPKAYAAPVEGLGFASLRAFRPIWTVFRDFVFLLFVIVIIAVGFMIMFRMKINPQLVVTIENSLPKIVITLLLITFSYAIAGFLIDLMYLVSAIGIDLLAPEARRVTEEVTTDLFLKSALSSTYVYKFGIYIKGLRGLYLLLPLIFKGALRVAAAGLIAIWSVRLMTLIGNPIERILGEFGINFGGTIDLAAIIGYTTGAIIGYFLAPVLFAIIFFIIALIGLLVLAFRIWFLLFSSYVQILVSVIFAPVLLFMEAVPGQRSFSSWFRGLIGNLSVFPIVIVLLLVASVIDVNATAGQKVLVPPLIGAVDPDLFLSIVSVMLLLMIPNLAKAVRKKIVGEAAGLPLAPGLLFGGAAAAGGGLVGLISQFGSIKLGMGALGRGAGLLGLKKPPERETPTTKEAIERIRKI